MNISRRPALIGGAAFLAGARTAPNTAVAGKRLVFVGRRAGLGNVGSGAFANCDLLSTHLGIWDRIERNTGVGPI